MLDPSEKTDLSELGEFGLIRHLTQKIELQNESTVKGVGDDAAVIDNDGMQTVVTTDMLLEGIHFDLTYVPLRHLGYKAVISNLSDVYAMMAQPQQIVVSLGISSKFPLEAIDTLYEGIHLACQNYNIDLVGGDTTSSASGAVISITAIGQVEKGKAVYRSTARENDLLVVSGDLGGAFMGLQVLEREKKVFKETKGVQPDLEGHDYILERQLKPEARRDIVKKLQDYDIHPTSMIDISDGLASETLHICEASNMGVELYEEKFPIDQKTYDTARDFNFDPTVCVLSGGEDYELLFTIPPEHYEIVEHDPDLTLIGHMTDASSGRTMTTKNNKSIELTAQGWDAILKS